MTAGNSLQGDAERRRRRAELVVAYGNAENADESARICAEISRLDEEVRTARPRTPTEHRARALRVLGPDRKTVAAGERD